MPKRAEKIELDAQDIEVAIVAFSFYQSNRTAKLDQALKDLLTKDQTFTVIKKRFD